MQSASVSHAALSGWISGCHDRAIACDDALPDPAAGDVPLEVFVALAERAAERSGRRSLGWVLGESHDIRLSGEVGHSALSCATLGAALRRMVDHFDLLQDATEMQLRVDYGACTISYRILDPAIWPRHQDAIFTMAILCQLIRRACAGQWDEVELLIEAADAEAGNDLARTAGTACRHGADANMIRFPAAWLDRPLPAQTPISPPVSPPDLRELNRKMASKRRGTSVELRVRALIYQHLGHRHLDQERVAAQLGMSSRTLRRRLAERNLSFQQVMDDCRMRMALHEFRLRGHLSLAQTALRLGYSEHSTFTRAFSRWSGMPPQAFLSAGNPHEH